VDSGRFSKNRLFIIQFFHRQIVPAFLTFFNCTVFPFHRIGLSAIKTQD
jgi:hypothetical protein